MRQQLISHREHAPKQFLRCKPVIFAVVMLMALGSLLALSTSQAAAPLAFAETDQSDDTDDTQNGFAGIWDLIKKNKEKVMAGCGGAMVWLRWFCNRTANTRKTNLETHLANLRKQPLDNATRIEAKTCLEAKSLRHDELMSLGSEEVVKLRTNLVSILSADPIEAARKKMLASIIPAGKDLNFLAQCASDQEQYVARVRDNLVTEKLDGDMNSAHLIGEEKTLKWLNSQLDLFYDTGLMDQKQLDIEKRRIQNAVEGVVAEAREIKEFHISNDNGATRSGLYALFSLWKIPSEIKETEGFVVYIGYSYTLTKMSSDTAYERGRVNLEESVIGWLRHRLYQQMKDKTSEPLEVTTLTQ